MIPFDLLTLTGHDTSPVVEGLAGRRWLLFLTSYSDDSKPYMILVALVKGFQNHIGFAIIRARSEEQKPPTSSRARYSIWSDVS